MAVSHVCAQVFVTVRELRPQLVPCLTACEEGSSNLLPNLLRTFAKQ